jgi:LysM domain
VNGKQIPILILAGLLCCAIFLAGFNLHASGQAYYYTPTPGPDGKIVYTVQQNDSCLSIALKNGISGDQIASLNKLKTSECEPGATLEPGRQLVLAVVVVLPTPTITNTPSGPTPTPFNGNGKACFILFHDVNENGIQDAGESSLASGTVGVVLPGQDKPPYTYFTIPESGKPATATTTADGQPTCIDGLPEGDYILTATLPEGYQATTNLIFPSAIHAGQTLLARFGAVPPNSPPPPHQNGSKGGSSALPLIFGGILVVLGAGMGVYLLMVRRINRKPPQS